MLLRHVQAFLAFIFFTEAIVLGRPVIWSDSLPISERYKPSDDVRLYSRAPESPPRPDVGTRDSMHTQRSASVSDIEPESTSISQERLLARKRIRDEHEESKAKERDRNRAKKRKRSPCPSPDTTSTPPEQQAIVKQWKDINAKRKAEYHRQRAQTQQSPHGTSSMVPTGTHVSTGPPTGFPPSGSGLGYGRLDAAAGARGMYDAGPPSQGQTGSSHHCPTVIRSKSPTISKGPYAQAAVNEKIEHAQKKFNNVGWAGLDHDEKKYLTLGEDIDALEKSGGVQC